MYARLQPFRVSLLAEILRLRAIPLTIASVAAAQLVAGYFHVGIPCVFHETTGMPCPGCGLTRSCLALLDGRLTDAVLLHPFGPFLLGALILCGVGSLLPDQRRQQFAAAIENVEIKTGLVPLLFLAFMLLWILRLTHVIHLASV